MKSICYLVSKKIFRDANLNNKNDSVINKNKKAPQRDALVK